MAHLDRERRSLLVFGATCVIAVGAIAHFMVQGQKNCREEYGWIQTNETYLSNVFNKRFYVEDSVTNGNDGCVVSGILEDGDRMTIKADQLVPLPDSESATSGENTQ